MAHVRLKKGMQLAYIIDNITVDSNIGFVYNNFPPTVQSITINYTTSRIYSGGSGVGVTVKGITKDGATIVLYSLDRTTLGTFTDTFTLSTKPLSKVIFAPYYSTATLSGEWSNMTIEKRNDRLYFVGTWRSSGNRFDIYFNTIKFNY